MKKKILVAALLGTACLLSGCSKFSPKETAVSVSKDGAVQSVVIENLDKDYYNEEELKSSINQTVSAYQASAGEKSVVLKEFKVDKGAARLDLDFGAVTDYAAFNQVDFFRGSVTQAQEKGYTFDGTFQSVTEGKSEKTGLAKEEVLAKDWQVLVLEEDMLVEVPGNIVFASDTVEITDKKQCKVKLAVQEAPQEKETEMDTQQTTGDDGVLVIKPEMPKETSTQAGKKLAYIFFE